MRVSWPVQFLAWPGPCQSERGVAARPTRTPVKAHGGKAHHEGTRHGSRCDGSGGAGLIRSRRGSFESGGDTTGVSDPLKRVPRGCRRQPAEGRQALRLDGRGRPGMSWGVESSGETPPEQARHCRASHADAGDVDPMDDMRCVGPGPATPTLAWRVASSGEKPPERRGAAACPTLASATAPGEAARLGALGRKRHALGPTRCERGFAGQARAFDVCGTVLPPGDGIAGAGTPSLTVVSRWSAEARKG
jgi:hypothetical protein